MPSKPPSIGRKHGSSAWRDQSEVVREREPLCRMCKALGRVVEAVCVDHKVPIADGGSMHDPENLQPLCAACHLRKSAIEGRVRMADRGRWPSEGTILLGAPGSGKTAMARLRATDRDYVWDQDAVLASLKPGSDRGSTTYDVQALGLMRRLRRSVLESWREGWMPGRLWWITTSPDEAREIMEANPTIGLVIVRASLDEIAQRIDARSWLTPAQRADLLGAARNLVASIDASGLREREAQR